MKCKHCSHEYNEHITMTQHDPIFGFITNQYLVCPTSIYESQEDETLNPPSENMVPNLGPNYKDDIKNLPESIRDGSWDAGEDIISKGEDRLKRHKL